MFPSRKPLNFIIVDVGCNRDMYIVVGKPIWCLRKWACKKKKHFFSPMYREKQKIPEINLNIFRRKKSCLLLLLSRLSISTLKLFIYDLLVNQVNRWSSGIQQKKTTTKRFFSSKYTRLTHQHLFSLLSHKIGKLSLITSLVVRK